MDQASREDELRPVTALFADVVGSTALGERLSPDEVKALIGEFVSTMSHAVEEYGGSVQAYMGDGICAYFGVPAAHEDDPERAARAGLRILEVVDQYRAEIAKTWGIENFNVRIGINSGQAAVGLVGSGDPQAVALGDATNVAARLQSAAEPGTIVVGPAVVRRLHERFVFEPLGEIELKGRSDSVLASRLMRPQADDRTPASTRLVGRARELEELRAVVGDLRTGRGQVLLLLGEMGIGKTRLLEELRRIAGDDVTWLEGHSLSYGGVVSWPFAEILRNWLGVDDLEPQLSLRTKARARLGALLAVDVDEHLPPLARLLGIQLDPIHDARMRLPPDALGQEIRRSYSAWIEALTQRRPVVVAIEDVHWSDPSARELAESLLELTDRAPLLLVATMAPDRASEGWKLRSRAMGDFAHRATEIGVDPLQDDAARELLTTLVPGLLDDAARQELVERAEGNPLYLEELLRALVEGGEMELRHRTWTLTVGSIEHLPPALENLLVARIDRLPAGARVVAQVAAAIGRNFPLRVLERIAVDGELQENLALLLRAEIVRELRRYPEPEYTFKHGLLQDAALSTLTPARRRELFGRVAAVYEDVFAGSLDDHLERLAHYYAQSENLAKALVYLERAGARAADLSAATQASDLLGRARDVAVDLGRADVAADLDQRLARLPQPAA